MFRLEWDDFSGGYFVGANDVDQPANTWTGTGVCLAADSGMLMPAGAVTEVTPSGAPGVRVSPQNFQQSGAPIVCSGFFNSGTTVKQIVVWVTNELAGSAPTDDMTVRATDGTTVIATTVAGSSGDYRYATSRPVAMANPASNGYQFAAVYFAAERSVGGTLTQFIYEYLPYTNAIASASLPAKIDHLERWKEYLVGAKFATNRMYFSGVLAPNSWGVNDWIEIGDQSPITAMVPVGNQLYVGKQQGWFVVSGVLGETTVVRQLESKYGPSSFGAAETAQGVMFARSDLGVTMMAQRGLRSAVVNYRTPASRTVEYHNPCDVSSGVVIAGGGPMSYQTATPLIPPAALYAWVFNNARWHTIALPTPSANFGSDKVGEFMWAKDYTHNQVGEEYAWLLMSENTAGTTDAPGHLYRHQLNLTDPQPSVSATARLAEWRLANKGSSALWFTVREAIAEIEIPPSTVSGTNVSLTVSAHMRGDWDDPSRDGTTAPASPQTVTLDPDNYAAARVRPIVRFAIGSTRGNAVVPVVTLVGCKLRRLTLICDEAGRP